MSVLENIVPELQCAPPDLTGEKNGALSPQ